VALLQEYAEAKIAAQADHWNADARRPEVMKAVLLNSADKIKDAGDGLLLGMEKTILNRDGINWLQSNDHDLFNPLDLQMGTGQLNASRAKTQFTPGEWGSSVATPSIGWDLGSTARATDIKKYVFEKKLLKDSYVSISLVWNRKLDLNDTNNNGKYDDGETFTDRGFTDMDLYFQPKGATMTGQSLASSISIRYNVEHIFFKIPSTDNYEIWVYQINAPNAAQTYALAWWTVAAP